MKYFIILTLLIPAILNAQVKKVDAVSEIKNVTVFSSGARIERVSSVNLSPGRTQVNFSGLSNQLDQQSVQLSSNENITLLSVQASRDFTSARKMDEEQKKFIDTVSSLKSQIDLQKKMLDVYKSEENMLIKNEAIGGDSGVKTAELKEALDLHRQRLSEVYKKQLEIQNNIDLKEKEFKAWSEQLKEFSKKKDSINYTVTALVDSKAGGNITFHLFYNIKDAGWYPAYDVRVKNISSPLEFLMNANVFQRSGETWKNVILFLSTGSPNENVTPTELQPWKIGFFDPSIAARGSMVPTTVSGRVTNEDGEPVSYASVIIKGTNKGTMTDANGFFKITDVQVGSKLQVSSVGFENKEVSVAPGYINIVLKPASQNLQEVVVTALGNQIEGKIAGVSVNKNKFSEEKSSIQLVDVTTQFQPTTIVYSIDEKYTIETDGKTNTIGIRSFDVPAGYQYFSAPKTDPASFLTAQILSWQDLNLQSGEVNLYFEGNYLGKTYLDLSGTGDTLSLSLGKDNGVKVTRKLIKEFSTRRFLGNNRIDNRQYEISVRNTKRESVQIRIQDQFPVSVVKEISVSDTKAPGAAINDDTGIATWDLNLAPGEERKVSIGYSVKYPKDRRVILE
ncbi:MAG: hypothetical protein B6D37_09050 [Sphingobacteriales bacterium UTBCD1]|jgi:hypothetical protein|nr:MAG: hypothetical protein B6D37_09050 [Sphingobacteriales bacterium UTBCD1]